MSYIVHVDCCGLSTIVIKKIIIIIHLFSGFTSACIACYANALVKRNCSIMSCSLYSHKVGSSLQFLHFTITAAVQCLLMTLSTCPEELFCGSGVDHPVLDLRLFSEVIS